MLERLTVSNLVLIRDADLDLAPGLNVVTGETGAGKTILTTSLDLVLGGRAEASMVGPALPECYVEATFLVSEELRASEAFDGVRELAGDPDEGLVLARRIGADGRGRALVSGRSATRGALESAGAEMLSVVSQHEARQLTRPAVQRRLLDGFVGPEQAPRSAAMARAWRALADARRAVLEAESDAAGAERLLEDLADLVRRVDDVAPVPGEEGDLRAERERLRHADALLAAAGGAVELLNPDEGDGAVTLASRAERLTVAAEGFDAGLGVIADELRDAVARLAEAARGLRSYADAVEHDPARLELVEARLERLADLARRHGSVEEAIAAAEEARERLARLERRDEDLAALQQSLEVATAQARGAADDLSTARRGAAGPFARAVEGHLADLGMADAQVDVRVTPRDVGASGADDVRFLIAPNRGVPPGSVADTASGGELSRITLAIRVAAQERTGVPTLLFDEIDAGVGGRTARTIADKLAALAGSAQVICVTHLAQIAARADRHFRVVKVAGDPTVTRIEQLTGDEIDAELARMLGGEEGSAEALQLARSLRSGG
jgi:DNA repair protein RecN (Recombination protein N)